MEELVLKGLTESVLVSWSKKAFSAGQLVLQTKLLV